MYYIIFGFFILVGGNHLKTILSAKKKGNRAIVNKKEEILGDMNVQNDSIIELSPIQFLDIKNNVETAVKGSLNLSEYEVFDSSLNSGSKMGQLISLSNTLNSSGMTSNVTFSTSDLSRSERRRIERFHKKNKKNGH